MVTHISLEWLGGGRWRLSVTRGQAGSCDPAAIDEPTALRRVSTVEGTLENVRRVALRALRTLELEFSRGLHPGGEHDGLDGDRRMLADRELETTIAYPISLDAVTPPVALVHIGSQELTPVVQSPFDANTQLDLAVAETNLEPSSRTLVLPPSFVETRPDLGLA